MKDKHPSPELLMPFTKIGVKKERMPSKKTKEPKTPIMKVSKAKKAKLKNAGKKPKIKKEIVEVQPKRKRGRPRNSEKIKIQEKLKNEKLLKGVPGRKKKAPLKIKEEIVHPPLKKLKVKDIKCNMNGNLKTTHPKSCAQKETAFNFVGNSLTNNINSNGTFHCENLADFNNCKRPTSSTMSKSVSFLSEPKNGVFDSNCVSRPIKSLPNKSIKSILKTDAAESLDSKDITTPIALKDIKIEKGTEPLPVFRSPVKLHPQRMASLDALAKMHVICIPDRKPIEHHSKSTTSVVTTVCSEPFTHQNSLVQCHSIQFDLKKEGKDFEGSYVRKQINFVKEKQQVFVSHSVQQSKTIKTVSKEKKKANPTKKSLANCASTVKEQNSKQKSSQVIALKGNKKSKAIKIKETTKKDARAKNKTKPAKGPKLSAKEKALSKSVIKVPKNVEQTKSKVKVKETIRMQKTCTYQSVTTVNSHGTTNSSVVPVSHVGLTTNYSKTKKTFITDEECKNKLNYSSDHLNKSYCVTTESPCSIGHHNSDYCKFHPHSSPQMIPVAHVQSCAFGHGMGRSDPSSSPTHCDGNFSFHRCGHQQSVIYSPPAQEYGCCCSSSPFQNTHDSCLVRKNMLYPHSHHSRLPSRALSSSEALCPDYHHRSPPSSTARQHTQGFILPSTTSSHSCTCCNVHLDCGTSHQNQSNCLHCLSTSSPKNSSSSLVPCEQSPLDLSLTSVSSSSSLESDIALQRGHCPSSMCCARDLLVLRTSTPHGFQHSSFSSNNVCCRYLQKQVSCDHMSTDVSSRPQCSGSSVQTQTRLPGECQRALSPSFAKPSTSGVTSKSIVTANYVPAKQEKSGPSSKSVKFLIPKKRQFAHGWSWKGKPREKLLTLTNDSPPCPRTCYPGIEHKEGDVILEKDCVLLKSGPKDTDLPYVAKVSALWENPEDGEMMMSLLWYYRPEHTDMGRKPGQREDEVFASRHKDVNSIACIEDKCYVLTYNEYCRYRASLAMDDDQISLATRLVPPVLDGYPRKSRLPVDVVTSDIIFFCRHVYDFRQKRILKNPT